MSASADKKQAKQQSGLLRGPSPDPEVAERQQSGLWRGNTKHGAYSAARREPLEDQHRERLRLAFPRALDDLVNAEARRCALVDLFAAHVADRGPMRGKGDVSPAARELRLLLVDHERAITALAEFERDAGAHGGLTLADIEREYAQKALAPADEDSNDGGDTADVGGET